MFDNENSPTPNFTKSKKTFIHAILGDRHRKAEFIITAVLPSGGEGKETRESWTEQNPQVYLKAKSTRRKEGKYFFLIIQHRRDLETMIYNGRTKQPNSEVKSIRQQNARLMQ